MNKSLVTYFLHQKHGMDGAARCVVWECSCGNVVMGFSATSSENVMASKDALEQFVQFFMKKSNLWSAGVKPRMP